MVLEKLINIYFKATTPAQVFKNIVCHDDLKEIMARSLFIENRTKTLWALVLRPLICTKLKYY